MIHEAGGTFSRMGLAPEQDDYVIAIDAGGTHTRVGCFALDGTALGFANGGGGSPDHNDDAMENVRSTITRSLEAGHLDPARATGLAAGIAGINRSMSNQGRGRRNDWAEHFVDVDGLDCPKVLVNDAVIAHRGALSGRAGIVVVAGTGSMILAISTDGIETESGQFEHYAGAARHVVHDVVQRILIGDCAKTDPLLDVVLEHFGTPDVVGLHAAVLARGSGDHNRAKRQYGGLAPQVTAMAGSSELADTALRDLVDRTARGVRLLAPVVSERPVPVSCTGALAATPEFLERLSPALTAAGPATLDLTPPRLGPLGGAAILALESTGSEPDEAVIEMLSAAYDRVEA